MLLKDGTPLGAHGSRCVDLGKFNAPAAELGNVAIVLLKLRSDSRHPDVASGVGEANNRITSDAIVTVGSAVLSVCAVFLDVVGFGRLMRSLGTVAAQLRRLSAPAPLQGPGKAAAHDRPDRDSASAVLPVVQGQLPWETVGAGAALPPTVEEYGDVVWKGP